MESRLPLVPERVHSLPVVSLKQAELRQPDSAMPIATATTRWPLRPLLAKPTLLAHEAQRRDGSYETAMLHACRRGQVPGLSHRSSLSITTKTQMLTSTTKQIAA